MKIKLAKNSNFFLDVMKFSNYLFKAKHYCCNPPISNRESIVYIRKPAPQGWVSWNDIQGNTFTQEIFVFNLAIVAFNSPIQDSSQFDYTRTYCAWGGLYGLLNALKMTLPSSPDGFFNGHSAKRTRWPFFMKGGTVIIWQTIGKQDIWLTISSPSSEKGDLIWCQYK